MTIFVRLRPAFAAFFAGCGVMAAAFGLVASVGLDPMPAAIYGPHIGTGHAALWAAVQGLAATAGGLACVHNKPGLAGACATILAVMFLVLASAGAANLPGGTAIMAMSMGAAPMAMAMAFYSLRGRHG